MPGFAQTVFAPSPEWFRPNSGPEFRRICQAVFPHRWHWKNIDQSLDWCSHPSLKTLTFELGAWSVAASIQTVTRDPSAWSSSQKIGSSDQDPPRFIKVSDIDFLCLFILVSTAVWSECSCHTFFECGCLVIASTSAWSEQPCHPVWVDYLSEEVSVPCSLQMLAFVGSYFD